MLSNSTLRSLANKAYTSNPRKLTLYLDTTYCHPTHTFPSQDDTINAVCDCLKQLQDEHTPQSSTHIQSHIQSIDQTSTSSTMLPTTFAQTLSYANASSTLSGVPGHLIVFGAYAIGKERVYMAAARELGCKVRYTILYTI